LAAAVQAADTREMSNPVPLQEVRLSFIRNQIVKVNLKVIVDVTGNAKR